jgi:hypothetical protein
MPQYSFGSGTLWGVRTDVLNSTPQMFGVLQEVSIDMSGNIKELFGQYQFPVAVGRGTTKVTGKAKFAKIQGALYNTLFFGGTLTASAQLKTANAEAGTIPAASGPYTITVTNGATWVDDLGVVFALTGLPLTKIASGGTPTTGQYCCTTGGVYTFAAADTTLGVQISYTYTVASAGTKTVVSNQLLGTSPIFMCNLSALWNNNQLNIKLHQCVANKLTFATKLEDFVIPEFDFGCFADSSGNIMTISTALE